MSAQQQNPFLTPQKNKQVCLHGKAKMLNQGKRFSVWGNFVILQFILKEIQLAEGEAHEFAFAVKTS